MKAHKPTLAAAIVAILVALTGLVAAVGNSGVLSRHQVRQTAGAQLRETAVKATIASQNTPVPACNPATGAAHMGSCAPVQALGAANALGKAAGDPDHISGKPLGVDVSSYQGCSLRWAIVRRGPPVLSFAIFKATEGTGYTDACLRHNVADAKAAGLLYGVYDFLRPSSAHSATAEALHFVAAVRAAGANTSLPPVADVEVNAGLSPAALHSYVCTWHRVVARELHRPVTITYTGNWFWGPQVTGGNCGTLLWVSAYAPFAITPHSWSKQTIWQYSDGIFGPTPHINRWDSDVFLGSLAQLQALAGAKAKPTAAQRKAAALKKARRSHRIVHAKIHKRCRGRARHSAGCHALFARNGRLHHSYGKALG